MDRDYTPAMKPTLTLGIMSGTSLDGVDYALCAIDECSLELRATWHVAFPASLRQRVEAAAAGKASSWETGQLHHDLGRLYAAGAARSPSALKPRLVGLHGQTIFHQPGPVAPATLQIGEPAYLTEQLRIPVVSNFRAADLAAGGEGAPLATAFHVRTFGLPGRHVCVNNLGGISNVTSIDWRRGPRSRPTILSFDTGPANVLIDLAARTSSQGRRPMDRNGHGAARGQVYDALLDRWLKHPFLHQAPPKSTGRELFGEAFWREAKLRGPRWKLTSNDWLATLTEFTARSIALNYQLHLPAPPEVVVLCGGGARNPVMRKRLARALGAQAAEVSLMTSEELGWPVASVEPAAFAWLAWLRMNGQPGNLPETTGARRAVLCGQITDTQPPARMPFMVANGGRAVRDQA